MKGGDSDADGLLVSSTNKNGKTTTEFVSPTIYYTTDDYYYIDSENVTAGDILVKPDSNETYRVGSDTATLKGVYNVNKGLCCFQTDRYPLSEQGVYHRKNRNFLWNFLYIPHRFRWSEDQ